jgi:hypothetical protein
MRIWIRIQKGNKVKKNRYIVKKVSKTIKSEYTIV